MFLSVVLVVMMFVCIVGAFSCVDVSVLLFVLLVMLLMSFMFLGWAFVLGVLTAFPFCLIGAAVGVGVGWSRRVGVLTCWRS